MSNLVSDLPNARFASPPEWYAIYTRHKHEKSVAQILTSKGMEIFLPLYSSARRWKDRMKLVSLPLFPCYVFLRGCLDRRIDIVTTPGFHALLSSAGQPLVIPTDEIEAVRRSVGSGVRVSPHPFLKCGERVRVRCGPLTGIEGILVRMRIQYRLVISVEMLGKAVSVEVDAFMVEKVSENRSKASATNSRLTSAQHGNDGISAAFPAGISFLSSRI